MKRGTKVINAAWQAAHQDDKCKCSHTARHHHHGATCTYSDPKTFKFCDCKAYRPGTVAVEGQITEEGTEMAKKAKKAPRTKKEKTPKQRHATLYIATAKAAPEKWGKDSKSFASIYYRKVKAAGADGIDPNELFESFTPAEKKLVADGSGPRGKLHSTAWALRQAGLLRVVKKTVQVAA